MLNIIEHIIAFIFLGIALLPFFTGNYPNTNSGGWG